MLHHFSINFDSKRFLSLYLLFLIGKEGSKLSKREREKELQENPKPRDSTRDKKTQTATDQNNSKNEQSGKEPL